MINLNDYESFYKHPYNYPISDNYVVDFDYFEAILDSDGKFYQAPNGHTIGLGKIAATKAGITYTALTEQCPTEYYADYMTWLQMVSGAVPVWRNFYKGQLNDAQRESLKLAKTRGWYTGEID